MRNKEKVKLSINDFRLLHETLINIGALGRIVDELLTVVHSLLEESLTNSLVDNHESNLWRGVLGVSYSTAVCEQAVLILAYMVQLFKLKINDLLTHRVADTVTIDENMVWHLTVVELSVALE